jgi:hypothetical protein
MGSDSMAPCIENLGTIYMSANCSTLQSLPYGENPLNIPDKGLGMD